MRHLRAHGSYLHKRSTVQHLTLVASKGEVSDAPFDRVTEAFGVENHPHLLHALDEGEVPLKRRVLAAMVSLFRLPRELVMCLKLGVLELVEKGLSHDDREVRELSAEVLSVIADSPCSHSALLASRLLVRLLAVFAAVPRADAYQCHLYDALISVSRVFTGARQLTEAGYLPVVLAHLAARRGPNLAAAAAAAPPPPPPHDSTSASAEGERRLRALRLLRHLLNDGADLTALRALELDAVGAAARALRAVDPRARAAGCDALAALAFADRGKKAAVDQGAVPSLCRLLGDARWEVAAAAAGALMVVAVRDEAKRQLLASDAPAALLALLQAPLPLARLNAVKLVAVAAAYPPARRALGGAGSEFFLRALAADADPLMARSARAALLAVQWQA